MSATPIYAELQQTVMDPETTDWDVSSPPAFAAELAEAAKRHATAEAAPEDTDSTPHAARTGSKRNGKSANNRAHSQDRGEDQAPGTSSASAHNATSTGPRGRSNRRHRAGE